MNSTTNRTFQAAFVDVSQDVYGRPGHWPAAPAPSRSAASAPLAVRTPSSARSSYLVALTWAFNLFNSARVIAYLPTLLAIHQSGDTSQHSLLTWCAWVGSNLTMAAWLYEHNGHRINRAIGVSLVNALMCLATVLLIAWYRF